MIDVGVMERMALANGAEDTRNAREFLASERENAGDPVKTPPFLHPPRWVGVGSPGDEPPAGRIGFLFGGIEECWRPEYDMSDPLRPKLKGYWVTQRWMSSHCDCESKKGVVMQDAQLIHPHCGRALENKHKDFASLRESILSLNVQVNEDALYNGYYPTIPGNDPAHHDPNKQGMEAFQGGDVLYGRPDANGVRHPVTGGREIKGGRREHREATKNMHYLSSGWASHLDRINADKKAERERKRKERADRMAAQMPRRLGEI